MLNRLSVATVGVVVFLSALLGSDGMAADADALTAGRHRKLPAGEWTWDAFVPSSYRADGTDQYPVLYLSSPTSNPGTFDLHDWAERRGVIIVSINDSENGQSGELQARIQEAVLAAARARLRTHPSLNFAAGISGGARASLALAGRRPAEFAGVLLQCMSGVPSADHIGVSWIHGAKDDVIGVEGVWSGYDRLARSGRATVVVNRSRKHTPGSKDEKEAAMEHLLWWGRMTHPGISRDERAVFAGMLNDAMVAACEITDLERRIKRIAFLAKIPHAKRAPAFDAMVAAWSAAWMQRIEGTSDVGQQLEWLMAMGEDPLARGIDRDTKRRCKELMRPLQRDEAAVAHYRCVTGWRELFRQEQRAGLNSGALQACQRGFAELAAAFPDHPMGQYAGRDARRLARHLGIE